MPVAAGERIDIGPRGSAFRRIGRTCIPDSTNISTKVYLRKQHGLVITSIWRVVGRYELSCRPSQKSAQLVYRGLCTNA